MCIRDRYQYADVVYIGGGFGEGIHNTLEPAVFSAPIIIGPKHEKFEETKGMIRNKGMKIVKSSADIVHLMEELQKLPLREELGKMNRQYLANNKGGTEKIYSELF